MTFRTPRRRISPRTKRRYRAIREFFRRALGSPSQPEIKISSSIAVNVTDLKRKIVGLEQQLDEVNKNCQDIACLDCSRKSETYFPSDGKHVRESESSIQSELRHEIDTIKEQTEASYDRKSNGIETKFLYKSSEGNHIKSEESVELSKAQNVIDANQTQGMLDEYGGHVSKAKNKKGKLHKITDRGTKLHKYRTRSVYESVAHTNSTSSFRSLANQRMYNSNPGYYSPPIDEKFYTKEQYAEPSPPHFQKDKKYRDYVKKNKIDPHKDIHEYKPNKIRKHKHSNRELDPDYIADIIKRQYRPMNMFGRKESDFSQISAPVCRDREFVIRDDIQEGTELCSCCYDEKKHRPRKGEVNEMRSICDTRLYSSKKHNKGKHRRLHKENYNNSDLYDLIPVKEKSSPKTRRKFIEDNSISYEEYYREVPPSPRTLRPRLNLKTQYNTEFEDYMAHVKRSYKKGSPHRRRRHRERIETETDVTSEPVPNVIIVPRKVHKDITCQAENQKLCPQENVTISSVQYPMYTNNDQINASIDTTLNKTQEIENPVDKTDKALCEIKDILQNFLHEIKKEAVVPPCDKSEVSTKIEDNENSAKLTRSGNSRHSVTNCGLGYHGSQYIPQFQNSCCYPMMPVCPMNCTMPMQNGFMMPSQSYTCTNCANAPVHDEHCCRKNTATTGTSHTETCPTDTCHTETEQLIKEIYKFVAQSPAQSRKKVYESSIDRHEAKKDERRVLTSRSVGESSRLSKHDVKVGTPPLRCYSKSCEAIGNGVASEHYASATNVSFSDTILEKLSLEVTQSTSETDMDTTITSEKSNPNKFKKVMRSIGFFKKKKKDVIEELSESESTVDVEEKPRSPYRQNVTNYMMHGQEYYQPPPMSPHYRRPNEYQPDYHPPYNPGLHEYMPPPPPVHDIYSPRAQYSRQREPPPSSPYHSKQQPTAPPYHPAYDNPYKQMQQPQVPLCLREIEVKSTGTQSERKLSFFRKIKKKIQPPAPLAPSDEYRQTTCSTQTQAAANPKPQMKPLFNWKGLQAKALAEHGKLNTDPMQFSLKTQKQLAVGDMKMRNAMLKKMFYKRNPFSPRNLIVRTLLGKDKSSFGDPPGAFRPRMFF